MITEQNIANYSSSQAERAIVQQKEFNQTLMEFVQKLDSLDQGIRAAMMLAQIQSGQQQEQLEFQKVLSDHLSELHQSLQGLTESNSKQNKLWNDELKALQNQLQHLQAQPQKPTLDWKLLSSFSLISVGILTLYTGLILYPFSTDFHNTLGKQQRIMSNVFVCTLKPDAQSCNELRRSIEQKESVKK